MKYSQLLNVLINSFYYLVLIGGIIIVGYLLWATFLNDDYVLNITESTGIGIIQRAYAEPLMMKDYIKLLITLLQGVFFIKTLYHLRNATLKMIRGDMFNQFVSSNLKWTGISIIIYMIIEVFRSQYDLIICHNQLTVELDFGGFESFSFILILGLFFILLSSVIKNAIQLKQENELTI